MNDLFFLNYKLKIESVEFQIYIYYQIKFINTNMNDYC